MVDERLQDAKEVVDRAWDARERAHAAETQMNVFAMEHRARNVGRGSTTSCPAPDNDAPPPTPPCKTSAVEAPEYPLLHNPYVYARDIPGGGRFPADSIFARPPPGLWSAWAGWSNSIPAYMPPPPPPPPPIGRTSTQPLKSAPHPPPEHAEPTPIAATCTGEDNPPKKRKAGWGGRLLQGRVASTAAEAAETSQAATTPTQVARATPAEVDEHADSARDSEEGSVVGEAVGSPPNGAGNDADLSLPEEESAPNPPVEGPTPLGGDAAVTDPYQTYDNLLEDRTRPCLNPLIISLILIISHCPHMLIISLTFIIFGGMRTDQKCRQKLSVNANPKYRSKVHRPTMKLIRSWLPLRTVRTRTSVSVESTTPYRRVLPISGAGARSTQSTR